MILYLISELDVGGAEKALFHLVCNLDARFGRPAVACLSGRGRVGDWLRDAGIDVINLDATPMMAPTEFGHLRRILRTGRYRLLHTFLYHANIFGRLAAIGTGVPVISSLRVMEVDRPFRTKADRWTIRFVAAETCVAEAVRQWSIKRGLPADKLVTIPNGVDCAAFQAPRGAVRTELGLAETTRVVLFIGRLHWQKGPDVLVNAAARLVPLVRDVRFLFVGAGPMETRLRENVAGANLGSHVLFLGRRDDIPALLADADVLAVPSRWEGMPNALLESMAAGRPAVAARVGGCPELVVDGQTGLLVPPEDHAALAAALEKVLVRKVFAEEMGTAARERAKSNFTIDAMVDRNEALYDRILARTGR